MLGGLEETAREELRQNSQPGTRSKKSPPKMTAIKPAQRYSN